MKKPRHLRAAALAALLALLPFGARAEQPPVLHYRPSPNPSQLPSTEARGHSRHGGAYERDGVMLRFIGGAGAGLARFREPEARTSRLASNRGLALPGMLSAGGSLRGPWALHADVNWIALVRVRSRGGPGETAERVRDLALGLGLGATYFFARSWFVTGSLGLALAVEDRDAQRPVQTNPGPILSAGFGCTFWVTPQWSVGTGAQAWYSDTRTRFAFDPGRMRLFAGALTAVASFH